MAMSPLWKQYFICVLLMVILKVASKTVPITTVHWKDVDSAVNEYVERQPFLIKHAPSLHWPITDYLRTHSVEQGNDRMSSYYQQRGDMTEMDIKFTYTNTRVRATNCTCFMPNISRSKCRQYVTEIPYRSKGHQLQFWSRYESNYAEMQQMQACSNLSHMESMNMETLFSAIHDIEREHTHQNGNTEIERSLYSTGNVPLRLYRDLNQFQPFFDTFGVNGAHGEWEIYVWIATQFTSPSRHYDSTNNLFFVLRGCKQFLLSPPSLSAFTLYPALHPAWRQEIVNSASNNRSEDGIIMYDARIDAGDVLYIPPFWLHKVHNSCLDTIATNAWYYSAMHEPINALMSFGTQRLPALIAYVDGMIDTYELVDEIMFFLHHFLPLLVGEHANRYVVAYPVLTDIRKILPGLNARDWQWLEWFIDAENMQKCLNGRLSVQLLVTRCYQCFGSNIPMKEWNQYIQTLLSIGTHISTDEAVLEVVMMEYVEKIWQEITLHHGDGHDDSDVVSIVPLLLTVSGL